MPLTLPTTHQPVKMPWRLITARNDLTPAFGGVEQRLNRKGSRYAFDIEMPAIRYEDALAWDDINTETDTVVLALPQPGLALGSPGDTRVNGAGQAGSSLIVDGFSGVYTVGKGWWVSVLSNGQRCLYRTAATSVVSGGSATLSLRTMLRKPPADNAVVEIAAPKVEGFATVADDCWDFGADRLVRLKFSIRERE